MRTALLRPTPPAGIAFLAVVALGACGENRVETPVEGDTSTTDVVVDTAPDSVTEDTDTSGDETDASDAPPTPEVCDDGVDNDGDGDIDCDDEDCPRCQTEDTPEACSDGVDNDLDGDPDCVDPDCYTNEYTGCDPPCWGVVPSARNGCPPTQDWELRNGPLSYLSRVQVPTHPSAECCFDFTGDDVINNGFARLVTALGVDVDGFLAERFRTDDVAIILEWRWLGTSSGLHGLRATNDVDRDGTPDDDFAARTAGNGTFELDPTSVDEYGPFIQFNHASEVDGAVFVGPSFMDFVVPITIDGFTYNLDLSIEQATLIGQISETVTGWASADAEFEIDGEIMEFGGVQMGGVIYMDRLGETLDALASECTCAGFDSSTPVIAYGDDGVTYRAECAQMPLEGCTESDGPVCANLDAICAFLPTMLGLGVIDVDTNNNGINDAMSVGLWLSLTGATLTDPPFPVEE